MNGVAARYPSVLPGGAVGSCGVLERGRRVPGQTLIDVRDHRAEGVDSLILDVRAADGSDPLPQGERVPYPSLDKVISLVVPHGQ